MTLSACFDSCRIVMFHGQEVLSSTLHNGGIHERIMWIASDNTDTYKDYGYSWLTAGERKLSLEFKVKDNGR